MPEFTQVGAQVNIPLEKFCELLVARLSKEQLEPLQESLNALHSEIAEVRMSIQGDGTNRGLAGRVLHLEKRTQPMRTWMDMARGIFVFCGCVGGLAAFLEALVAVLKGHK